MSDPWASDFRALREHTRRGAPSVERTREFVLASAKTPEPEKEKNMSFIKRRPALAIAIALALIAVLTPVAYAVVNKVFLSIDPDQSEEQIEQDVKRQLDEAGVATTGVTAEKDGDKLRIGIQSDDPAAELPELDVNVRGGGKPGETLGQNRVQIEAHCELSPEQMEALTQVVSSDEFLAAVVDRHDRTDAEVAAALREVLRRHGFDHTDVSVSGQGVAVTVNAPPT
jgi:hypothetical protein